MVREIERKFLIKYLPSGYEQFPSKKIIQGYFYDPHTGKRNRVRKIGEKYTLTKKTGHGLIKNEIEITITKDAFDAYRRMVGNHFLTKTRYYLPYQGFTIELDIYDNLHGLIVAEVEFKTKKEAQNFIKPERFGEELTMIKEATNAYIACHGLSDKLLNMMKR